MRRATAAVKLLPKMTLGRLFNNVLAAARRGENSALATIYEDLHPSLLSYLSAQEPNDADDLASEVWIDVASGLSRFQGDERSFRGWLFTIARRRLIDLRRSATRRRTFPTPVEAFVGRAAVGGPEPDVLVSGATRAALDLIRSLPPDQAEVLLLRVVAGLEVADVAEVMGKRPGTIRVLQHRALKRLSEEISREM